MEPQKDKVGALENRVGALEDRSPQETRSKPEQETGLEPFEVVASELTRLEPWKSKSVLGIIQVGAWEIEYWCLHLGLEPYTNIVLNL